MKCLCLWIDRGLGLLRKGKFETIVGEFKTSRFFGEKKTFYIPEKFKSILMEKEKCPLFIIDAKNSIVLNAVFDPKDKYVILNSQKNKKKIVLAGLDFTSPFDPTVNVKLNVLIKGKFWEMLAKMVKQKWLQILIQMGAGYGLFRFIEYVIRIIFLRQG